MESMSTRKIHLHDYPAAGRKAKGSLLFVHGAYVNSSCWEFNFIPFFRRRGYDCFALDLSGHGASEGRERIDQFGIDDYAVDLAWAVRQMAAPPTLIGHSMGARVVERYLERGEAAAAIFLAPVPTTGTAGSALQIGLQYPSFFQVLEDAVDGRISDEVAELMTRIYFAPGTRPHETLRFLPMVGPESQRAIAEMAWVQTRRPVRRGKLPALVVGGARDAVFPSSMLHFSAAPWEADCHRIDGAGHMLMLDPQWEETATRMLTWLEDEDLGVERRTGQLLRL